MTWIKYDVSEELIVINFTDFCKSFCFCGTQFRTFTATDECFNSFSLPDTCETDPSANSVRSSTIRHVSLLLLRMLVMSLNNQFMLLTYTLTSELGTISVLKRQSYYVVKIIVFI